MSEGSAVLRVAEMIGAHTGHRPDEFVEAASIAMERTMLDDKTIAARVVWLFDRETEENSETRRIDLLASVPSATPADMANWIASPKDVVFNFIIENSDLTIEALEIMYRTMMNTSSDPYGLPDFTSERILQEMKWWIVDLAFPEYYYQSTPPEEIAHQILINRFHEVQGSDSESYRNMKVSYVSPGGSHISWVHSAHKFLEVEAEIEALYYTTGHSLDVSVYSHHDLYLYITRDTAVPSDATDFEHCLPGPFQTRDDEERRERYHQVWEQVRRTGTFQIDLSRKTSTGEYRLMVGFPPGLLKNFMASVSRALLRKKTVVIRKYLVAFGGRYPIVISSFYSTAPFSEGLLTEIADIGLYPDGPLAVLAERNVISAAQADFAHAVVGYVHAFITVRDANIEFLADRFAEHRALQELFANVRRSMARDTFPVEKIVAMLSDHPDLLRAVFEVFKRKFDPHGAESSRDVTPDLDALQNKLPTLLPTQDKIDAFRCALALVRNTVRTNFFLPVKTALAFRLDPTFLSGQDYQRKPFAVFYVVGRDFTGFHVRFGEIARGGIRILRSANSDEYRANAETLFDECFGLASTQDRKNKDIPEKGSKGVILPTPGHDDKEGRAEVFRKYVDALLDLMLPENSPKIVNWREEILFLGPDENSAELMDWACERARDRGYIHWKSFTTGKSSRLGGVSHIDYAMTTNGVHRYVVGILRELGIEEATITKIQTGGPDGDLGGNEILNSNDTTIAVVDGGGVLYDPDGLDRRELRRLAQARIDSSNYDRSLLSHSGFLVRVTDTDITLPDGTVLPSGLTFRNTFHLSKWMQADLFMPCGGRPQSINSTNWAKLLTETGEPRFRWIVEGANLFISPEARLKLEEAGIVLFKDASTNKGGVTSSSYEVLAGLALGDAAYRDLMCTADGGTMPAFRSRYIDEIQERIRENADAEFNLLWRLNRELGIPLTTLSDMLSNRILEVTNGVETSSLFEEGALVRSVLRQYIPRSVAEVLGVDGVLRAVPKSYLAAAFARTVAARFVYRFGIDPSYEDYRRFTEELKREAKADRTVPA